MTSSSWALLVVAFIGLLVVLGFLMTQFRPARVAPPSPAEVKKRRTGALLGLYELTGADTGRWVRSSSLRRSLDWTAPRTRSVLRSLVDLDYAELHEGGQAVWESLLTDPARARLTGKGQQAAMRLLEDPTHGDADLAPMVSIGVNYAPVNTGSGTQTWADRGGTTTISETVTVRDSDVRTYIGRFEQAMDDAPLPPDLASFARQNLDALHSQLEEPSQNQAVQRGALRSLGEIAESVGEKAAWATVQALGRKLGVF